MGSLTLATFTGQTSLTNIGTTTTIFPDVTGGSTRLFLGPRTGSASVKLNGSGQFMFRTIQLKLFVRVFTNVATNFTTNINVIRAGQTDLTSISGGSGISGLTQTGGIGEYQWVSHVAEIYMTNFAGVNVNADCWGTVFYLSSHGTSAGNIITSDPISQLMLGINVSFFPSVQFATGDPLNAAALVSFQLDQL